ncbi:MAG: tRNA dihydrouridine synthase DusB [Bacteroidia bacterium]|nr:tRNA dihydrouridine synthase DusB [Bacteroidia bacterium]
MVYIGPIAAGEFPLLLAPMEDVSDPPFRRLCKEYGADLVFTEFVSSEGLIREAAQSLKKLDVFPHERPVAVQLFGDDIEAMRAAAQIAEKAGPDFIDINYGCPVKKVVCKGAGAALLKDPVKMERMTREIVRAVGLPVTVKTRLGWDEHSINIVEVALRLQDAGIQALSIHARTRAQLYKGEADWSYVLAVKSHPDIQIPVFGNGDIDSPEKAHRYRLAYRPDGMMIGRAAIGSPWIFRAVKHFFATGERLPEPSIAERVAVCRRHLELSIEWKGEKTGIYEMRRHYANYFKGLPDFKPYRMRLVQAESSEELFEVLERIRQLRGCEAVFA